MGLLSYFFSQLGGGVTYTYIERIARDAGRSSELVGFVLSMSAILSAILYGRSVLVRLGSFLSAHARPI